MSGIYYTEAADWLRAVGLTVVECDGWQTRARSSGGFASPPLGVQWHHTASKTTPENDTAWQCEGSDDAPIGNGTIMRDGAVWLVAAGAANTAGKGGPITFSRGTVPQDSGNSTTWAWEVANNGVGEPWPQVQIDAYFTASNEMNRRFGNVPTDIMTHAGYCQPSCPGRKIDPATADADTTPPPEPEPEPPPEVDVPLTDDDIARIAQKTADLILPRIGRECWGYMLGDIVTNQMNEAGDIMRSGAYQSYKSNPDNRP